MTDAVLGTHLLVDFYGVSTGKLTDAGALETVLVKAARAAGAVPLEARFHTFGGGGVTGVVLLQESHISVHTWPEHDFAAIDVFMCGNAQPMAAVTVLEREWQPQRVVLRKSARGDGLSKQDLQREMEV